MRPVLLTRHGETAWNALGRLQGATDIELSDVGRGQARALAASFGASDVASVWTSDLARARETGAIIAAVLGLTEPRIDPELRERNFGVFEGLTRDEIASQYPEAWRAWREHTTAPPGGEPRDATIARMTRVLTRLAGEEGGPVLVISHGGVMRLWLMEVLGATVPLVANGTTYVVEHDGSAFRARLR
ncbi:MAG TPA: histidine phosphatase family protein [Kofleriaceae bacterium]